MLRRLFIGLGLALSLLAHQGSTAQQSGHADCLVFESSDPITNPDAQTIFITCGADETLQSISAAWTSARAPQVSPDGQWIAFIAQTDDHETLILHSIKSGEQQSAATGSTLGFPRWSSNGQFLFYTQPTTGDMACIDVTTLDQTCVPDPAENAGWRSPDAEWIITVAPDLAQGCCDPPNQLFLQRAAGTGLRQITDLSDGANEPAWSPDSTRIAFVCGGKGRATFSSLCVINRDGSSLMHITDPRDDHSPQWSSDGEWIGFVSLTRAPGSLAQIFRVRPDGTDLQQVTFPDSGFAVSTFQWIPARLDDTGATLDD
jgi:Tol biopolymer transport system component